MYPPIFATAAADAAVTALIGSSPVRFFPAGEAPQDVARPYATWQIVSGTPENYLDKAPDIDRFTVQVDVWAQTVTSARNVAAALRDAFEPEAHVVAWRGEDVDATTSNHRYSFDIDWFVSR